MTIMKVGSSWNPVCIDAILIVSAKDRQINVQYVAFISKMYIFYLKMVQFYLRREFEDKYFVMFLVFNYVLALLLLGPPVHV